jgi:hypothetical protein
MLERDPGISRHRRANLVVNLLQLHQWEPYPS